MALAAHAEQLAEHGGGDGIATAVPGEGAPLAEGRDVVSVAGFHDGIEDGQQIQVDTA